MGGRDRVGGMFRSLNSSQLGGETECLRRGFRGGLSYGFLFDGGLDDPPRETVDRSSFEKSGIEVVGGWKVCEPESGLLTSGGS